MLFLLQALQKELGSRTPSYNSVLKEGKELVKSKKAEGKAVLKRKLIDLKCEWESVCNLSVARQQKLEETVKKMHLFGSHLKPMKEWISELLLTHESKEPVYGDIDTVSDLLMSHTVRNTCIVKYLVCEMGQLQYLHKQFFLTIIIMLLCVFQASDLCIWLYLAWLLLFCGSLTHTNAFH